MKYIPSLIIIYIFIRKTFPYIKKQKSQSKKILTGLLMLYFVLLFLVTLVPFRPLYHLLTSGLHFNIATKPYFDIKVGHGRAVLESFLNVVMMMPFGFLVKAYSDKSIFKITLYGLFLSISIEFLQLFDALRASDITDIINNTLGAFLGACLFVLMKFVYEKFKER